jgi:hypothetical protein
MSNLTIINFSLDGLGKLEIPSLVGTNQSILNEFEDTHDVVSISAFRNEL